MRKAAKAIKRSTTKKGKSAKKAKDTRPWTRAEVDQVVDLYTGISGRIEDGNSSIVEKARELQRPVKAVEAQPRAVHFLATGSEHTFGRPSRTVMEAWEARRATARSIEESRHSPLLRWSIDKLAERAFGGVDVATRPQVAADGFWHRGPGPYGVERDAGSLGRSNEATTWEAKVGVVVASWVVPGMGNLSRRAFSWKSSISELPSGREKMRAVYIAERLRAASTSAS